MWAGSRSVAVLGAAAAFVLPAVPVAAAPVTYGVPTSFFSGYGSGDFASGDVDGDGLQDLVLNRLAASTEGFGNDPNSGINLMLGEPGGGFADPVPFAGGSEPFKIVTADLNGDGLTDVATANPDGTIEEPALGSVSVFLADGNGGFFPAVLYRDPPFPVGITAADFDGDGDVDLATINYLTPGAASRQGVNVQLNNGDGSFAAARVYRTPRSIDYQIGSGDLDGDGVVDIVVGGFGTVFSLLYGQGDGSFQAAQQVGLPARVGAPTVADLDGDGFGEVLFNSNDTPGGFYVFPGSVSGLGAPVLYSEGQYVSDLQVVDLDTDGNLDVVTASLETRGVRVYYGNGTLALGPPLPVRMADPPLYLEVLDADADGRLDLVTTSPEYSSLYQPEITPHFVSVAYAAHSVPTADLALSVDCGGQILVQGRTRDCELTVLNEGPRTASNVVVTSGPQPFLTVLGSPTATSGECVVNAGDIAFRCTIPSLASGATASVIVELAYNDEVSGQHFDFSLYFRPVAYADIGDRSTKDNVVEQLFRTPKCTITGRDRLPDGTILGTEGTDVICGSADVDRIVAMGGDDLIYGRNGADVIDGGAGDDIVYGENGNDTIQGGDGDDLLFGGSGADTIDGGPGTDDCRPESGRNPPTLACP